MQFRTFGNYTEMNLQVNITNISIEVHKQYIFNYYLCEIKYTKMYTYAQVMCIHKC